jgi:methionyl-tRNA formyltransferase
MDKGLDTGPIIAQRCVPIDPEETHPELSARLALLGAELLAETLHKWMREEVEAVPQGDEGATLTRTLTKEDGLIDWSLSAEDISRRVRALQPWPGTYTYWGDRLLKILRARSFPAGNENAEQLGTVNVINTGEGKQLAVQTGNGLLQLVEVQLAGKPPTEARALLSGYAGLVGSVLGSPQQS